MPFRDHKTQNFMGTPSLGPPRWHVFVKSAVLNLNYVIILGGILIQPLTRVDATGYNKR